MLAKGIVAPAGFFDDTVHYIKEKATKQLEKRRFMDAAYAILLVVRLLKDTTIADVYFDCLITQLKAEALGAINAGRALSIDNILDPSAKLLDYKIAIGCFDDLF
jgi:hypothetical protein